MKSNQEKIKRIIWGVDALDPELKLQLPVMQTLRTISRMTGAQIQPVYIFSLGSAPVPSRLSEIEVRLHSERAVAQLGTLARMARMPTLLAPRIIFERARRMRDATSALWRFAVEEQGDLITVATRGHWGARRLFMGSFAESLILTSTIPVLTVSPETRIKRSIRRILFPTDLGSFAAHCFDRALGLARELRTSITVFHSAPIPNGLAIQQSIRSHRRVERELPSEWRKEFASRMGKLAVYRQHAREAGVSAETFLDASGLGLTSAILSAIEKMRADLVAMPAQSGGFRAILAGSTTRQVARTASCPVWILHEARSGVRESRAA